MAYVKTDTILDKILARKEEEVAARKQTTPEAKMVNLVRVACVPRDFKGALQKANVALIAEVKKASPSKGVLIEDFDPVQLGRTYATNGASAISVLTDEDFFQGKLKYLQDVRGRVSLPILRKDFIIDPYQVLEARSVDADAVLLIVAALEDGQMKELYDTIIQNGMTPLVEVHNEAELDRALALGATVVGINNRDLKTFNVDLNTTARLAQRVPPDVVLIAESGIRSEQDVKHMGALGASAVLVGESLVKAAHEGRDLGQVMRAFSDQPRKDES